MTFSIQTQLYTDINYLLSIPLYRKYFYLFAHINFSVIKHLLPDYNDGLGCTGFSRWAMIRAIIIQQIEKIGSIPKLIIYLRNHPDLIDMCGFKLGKLPVASTFYEVLSSIPVSAIHTLRHHINHILIDKGVISMEEVAIDSKPIKANTRHNNPKNHNRNLVNKRKKPKRNKKATLGYYSTHKDHKGEKHTDLFWGYRSHTIIDLKSGLALVELTLPNNYSDNRVAKILMAKLKKHYPAHVIKALFGDKAYDDKKLKAKIKSIIRKDASLFIGKNFRNSKISYEKLNSFTCSAGLCMSFDGTLPTKNGARIKYRCPIASRKHNSNISCPIDHPSLSEGACYGCITYVSISKDQDQLIKDYIKAKKSAAKPARKRQKIEMYFARYQILINEKTSFFNFNSIRAFSAIAHLTLSAIALTATSLGRHQHIRSIMQFAA